MSSLPIPNHPGLTLLEDFLVPLGETPEAFAKRSGIDLPTVEAFVEGQRKVDAALALQLAMATVTTQGHWLEAQRRHDAGKRRARATVVPRS